MYKEWYIWSNDLIIITSNLQVYYTCYSEYIYDMDKTSDVHLNAKLCT